MKNLIFIHGLNNNDHIWDEFLPFFENDYQIHKIRLLGQQGDYEQLAGLTKKALLDDLKNKLALIDGPKYIIAYSMGAVSFASVQSEIQDIQKIVMLAPAFKVRFDIVLKLALRFPKSFELKSIPPEKYMLYPKLPLNIYQVLTNIGESIDPLKLPKEMLIFCSKTDLLVSYKHLVKLQKQFPGWQLINLDRPTTDFHPAFQHMIFNEKYLGDLFKSMLDQIQNYFKEI